jgi:hypothetical protein
MYRILHETSGPFVALQVNGTLESEDYAGFLPFLQSKITEHGKIDLFWEMKDFDGWTASGLWSDGSFDVKHASDFRRIAVVGDKKWQEWMTAIMKPFTSAEVRYFDHEDRSAAMDWSRRSTP